MANPSADVTIIRLPQVKARLGVSRSSIYSLVKSGKLKAPISLGARSVGWLSIDVDEFINSRIKECRPERAVK